ncbi:MAG TPA: phage tail tape measure protein [Steroidobacteraceae bacterium]|nr:phage tail tape measure protein [Steroidobacteraceae bacterium]
MAILTYELRAVGEQDIARALASVERRFASHAVRINRALAIGGGSVRSRAAANPDTAGRAIVRQNLSIVKSFDDGQKRVYEATKRYEMSSHRQSLRNIEDRKKEEIKAIRDTNREWVREQKNARASFSRAVTGGATKGVGALAAVGKAGLATLGVGGSVLAASSVTEALKLDELTRRLVVNARGPGEAGKDPGALRKKIVGAGLETGIAPEQIAQGALAFVGKTGDLDTAEQNLKNFALVAQATGSSVEDVAKTAAALTQNFDIKSTKDMGDALAVLAFQGKKGAFELKNMAEEFPELGGAAQRIGLKGVGGMRTLGGLAQIAQRGTGGDGANASTSLQAMFTQLTAKAGELHSGQALGGKRVDVFQGGDPTKAGRDIPTVLAEIISRSHGNQTQLTKLFDIRGMKAASPLINEYHRAADAAKGTDKQKEKAGYDAIIAMIKDAAETSGKFSDVQKDAADVQKSSSIQLETAIMELKQAFADDLMPVVKDLIPHVRELGPVFRVVTQDLIGLAKFLADNPFAGLAGVMAAAITTELAKAQLAQLVSTGVVTPLGALGLAAAALTSSFLAAKSYIDGKVEQGKQHVEDAAKGAKSVNDRAQAELDATGKISPETAKQLADLQATQNKTLTAGDAAAKEGYLDYAGRALNQFLPAMPTTDAMGHFHAGTKSTHNLDEWGTLSQVGGNKAYNEEASRTRSLLQQAGGGTELKAAASALQDAATALKAAGPNRGNAPSPVKG